MIYNYDEELLNRNISELIVSTSVYQIGLHPSDMYLFKANNGNRIMWSA